MNDYQSYPAGREKLAKKLVPFYMRPVKNMMMRLLIKILSEG